jgi:hypothetical protein
MLPLPLLLLLLPPLLLLLPLLLPLWTLLLPSLLPLLPSLLVPPPPCCAAVLLLLPAAAAGATAAADVAVVAIALPPLLAVGVWVVEAKRDLLYCIFSAPVELLMSPMPVALSVIFKRRAIDLPCWWFKMNHEQTMPKCGLAIFSMFSIM